MNFCDTIHCKSKVHCKTCRDREGGRQWRDSLTVNFAVPEDRVDFTCPYGKKWGQHYVGDRLGSVIGKIRNKTPCWVCNQIEAGLNGIDKAARKLIHVSR